MLAVASFVAGGILERYPKLKVGFMEAGVGWAPWLWIGFTNTLNFCRNRCPGKTRPGEWIKSDNCYFAVEPEETTIPFVAQMVGEERLVYASDYSHWDCLCPDSVKLLRERTDFSDSLNRKSWRKCRPVV